MGGTHRAGSFGSSMASTAPVTGSQARSLPDVGTGSRIWGLAVGLWPPPWGVDSLLEPRPPSLSPRAPQGPKCHQLQGPRPCPWEGHTVTARWAASWPVASWQVEGKPGLCRWLPPTHDVSSTAEAWQLRAPGGLVLDSEQPASPPAARRLCVASPPAAPRLCVAPGVAGSPCHPATSAHRRPPNRRAPGAVSCLGLRS